MIVLSIIRFVDTDEADDRTVVEKAIIGRRDDRFEAATTTMVLLENMMTASNNSNIDGKKMIVAIMHSGRWR
jgi:hypothetical protein